VRRPAFLDRQPPTGLRRSVLIVAGGALLGLSYPPFPFAPLAWLALVPLLLLWLEHSSARTAFVDAYAAFLITFAIAFQWPLLHLNAGTALLSLPGLLVIPMWMAIPFGLSHLLRRRAGPAIALLGFAALFVSMEWGLRRGPFAVPWSLLGHSQSDLAPLNRLARLGGVPLLTAYVLVLNLLAFSFVSELRRLRRPLAALAIAGLLAAVVLRSFDRTAARYGEALRIGIVQPAVTASTWADLYDPARLEVLLTLSDSLLASTDADTSSIDLVVWPETALPPGDAASRRLLREWVDAHGVPLLAGAVEDASGSYFNAALLFRPHEDGAVYRKRRLVPFAEHVPFQSRWRWVRRLAVPSGGVAGYVPGSTGNLLEIPEARFGVLICFETLFDDAARAYARRGADLIVAITQDGWWGDSFGYRQHFAFNRLRAIETGRSVVQVSVSGLSAVIDPNGASGVRYRWMERRADAVVVRAGTTDTLFMKTGDWLSPLAFAASLLMAFVALLYRR